MEKTNKQKINLGVFVVIATGLLIIALYFIGSRQHLFNESIVLKAQFYNVNGLQVGNNVRFAGVDAGTVSTIHMTSDSTIVIDMRIQKETTRFLKTNAIATIGSDGLVGNMIVNITPRKGNASPVMHGDTLETYSKIATEDMLSTLSVTNENAALLTADLLEITSQILDGKGTLAMLINDPQVANDLKLSIGEIRTTSKKASQTLSEIHTFSKLLNTEGSIAQLVLSDTISGSQVKEIIKDISLSSDHLKATTLQLKTTINEFDQSNGAFNYLVKDTLLPRQIEATVKEIKESSEKLNENMEALKSNFLFRGYFNKQKRQLARERRKLDNDKTTKNEN